jgi:phosphoadenosine phosphosulfate reductase
MTSLAASVATKADAARTVLARIARDHEPAVFTTSFGAEDMVVFDLIAGGDDAQVRAMKTIAIATLDTGRLPDETYQVWQAATERYRRKVESYFPAAQAVEQYVRVNGINAFYESVAQRKDCCHIRKVEPLGRALAGKRAWITGLRRAQAASRADLDVESFDDERGLLKVSPLADWSEDDVWNYLRARDVPVNALHARGYPSIGCAPCTRAIAPGEDLRAGRWWWENADAKECGLHVHAEDDPVVTERSAAQPA